MSSAAVPLAATPRPVRGPDVAWSLPTAGAGVEAGTLLGVGGTEAADLAGAGVVAVPRRGARTELRAARDGVPRLDTAGARVEPGATIDGRGGAPSALDIRGSLAVDGHVGPGRILRATGSLRVAGNVDRAELVAGVELAIEGRVGGSELAGGGVHELRRRLHRPLREAAAEIDGLVGVALQLGAAAAARGVVLGAGPPIRTLAAGRYAGLAGRLSGAATLLEGPSVRPAGACDGLVAAVALARAALEDPDGLRDPLATLSDAAGFLLAAIPERRPAAGPGVRVGAAHSCSIATAGTLRLTGAGASDCDLAAGEDLLAVGSGGAVRGGHVRVGSRVRVRELAGRGSARLRVVVEGPQPGAELLRADVVQPGVEVVVGREVVSFGRRRTGVRIRLEAGGLVVEGG